VNTFRPAGETLVEQGKEGQTTKRACSGVFLAAATDDDDDDDIWKWCVLVGAMFEKKLWLSLRLKNPLTFLCVWGDSQVRVVKMRY
jgi:hypothetical protein